MAYKVEDALDLRAAIVVSTIFHMGHAADMNTILDAALVVVATTDQAGAIHEIKAIVADDGHHATSVITLTADLGRRAYISERA